MKRVLVPFVFVFLFVFVSCSSSENEPDNSNLQTLVSTVWERKISETPYYYKFVTANKVIKYTGFNSEPIGNITEGVYTFDVKTQGLTLKFDETPWLDGNDMTGLIIDGRKLSLKYIHDITKEEIEVVYKKIE